MSRPGQVHHFGLKMVWAPEVQEKLLWKSTIKQCKWVIFGVGK